MPADQPPDAVQERAAAKLRPQPSRGSLRGLDWFIFFVADVQTGFGPFVAVYLTAQNWTQVDIGLVLSAGALSSLLLQLPGGATVDAARSERLLAGAALATIAASALAYALWPIFPVVLAAAMMHAAASCVLGPSIAALSLGLVGHASIGERLGRNARYAAAGNAIAAAAMGACGYLFSPRAVFFVTAALLLPTLMALSRIRPFDVDPDRAHGGRADAAGGTPPSLLARGDLWVLAGCIALFHLANAAMLPLMGSAVTMRSSEWAAAVIAACIILPQLIVATVSPWVGRRAQSWGRRPFFVLAYAALTLRGLLFALGPDPHWVVAIQMLDGITAATFGVMVPLMVADLTRGTGRFNLGLGFVGTAAGIGASISPTLGGYLFDSFGSSSAFLGLTLIAALGLAAAFSLLPETRPMHDRSLRA